MYNTECYLYYKVHMKKLNLKNTIVLQRNLDKHFCR